MLRTIKTLKNYTIQVRDGVIGKIQDVLLDDEQWTARYLVVDTGGWLFGHQVLLSPHSISSVDDENKHVVIELTKKQIEDSPPLASDQPISRQFETSHSGYYGWPIYWGTPSTMGMSPMFGMPPINTGYRTQVPNDAVARDPNLQTSMAKEIHDAQCLRELGNPHLRSANEITGYSLIADDGEVGQVADFILDEDGWAFRYLIIATGTWWSGKNILISPHWVSDIRWSDAKVFVHMLRSIIKQAPVYSDKEPLTRAYEAEIHSHYQRHGYWIDNPTLDPRPV